jgi:hypothetical protein
LRIAPKASNKKPVIGHDLRSLGCEVVALAVAWRPALVDIDDLPDRLAKWIACEHIRVAIGARLGELGG